MKIIIDIPDDDYRMLIQRPPYFETQWDLVKALQNGTILTESDTFESEVKNED